MSKMNVEEIARLTHEVNRLYCQRIGDNSQVPWEDAPDWQKESAIQGVQFVLDNPKVTSNSCHENWLEKKIEDGWVYGKVKDEEAKTHPCMVKYSSLPPEQRAKDKIFKAMALGK